MDGVLVLQPSDFVLLALLSLVLLYVLPRRLWRWRARWLARRAERKQS